MKYLQRSVGYSTCQRRLRWSHFEILHRTNCHWRRPIAATVLARAPARAVINIFIDKAWDWDEDSNGRLIVRYDNAKRAVAVRVDRDWNGDSNARLIVTILLYLNSREGTTNTHQHSFIVTTIPRHINDSHGIHTQAQAVVIIQQISHQHLTKRLLDNRAITLLVPRSISRGGHFQNQFALGRTSTSVWEWMWWCSHVAWAGGQHEGQG